MTFKDANRMALPSRLVVSRLLLVGLMAGMGLGGGEGMLSPVQAQEDWRAYLPGGKAEAPRRVPTDRSRPSGSKTPRHSGADWKSYLEPRPGTPAPSPAGSAGKADWRQYLGPRQDAGNSAAAPSRFSSPAPASAATAAADWKRYLSPDTNTGSTADWRAYLGPGADRGTPRSFSAAPAKGVGAGAGALAPAASRASATGTGGRWQDYLPTQPQRFDWRRRYEGQPKPGTAASPPMPPNTMISDDIIPGAPVSLNAAAHAAPASPSVGSDGAAGARPPAPPGNTPDAAGYGSTAASLGQKITRWALLGRKDDHEQWNLLPLEIGVEFTDPEAYPTKLKARHDTPLFNSPQSTFSGTRFAILEGDPPIILGRLFKDDCVKATEGKLASFQDIWLAVEVVPCYDEQAAIKALRSERAEAMPNPEAEANGAEEAEAEEGKTP